MVKSIRRSNVNLQEFLIEYMTMAMTSLCGETNEFTAINR